MDNKQFSAMIIVFLVAILGTVFVVTISDTLHPETNTYSIVNESLDYSSARLEGGAINTGIKFNLTEPDRISITEGRVGNGSVLVVDTDYTVSSTVEIAFLDTDFLSNGTITNNTFWDYNYYPQDYIKNSASRVMLRLIPLLFVLGIVMFVLAIVFRKEIMDAFGISR